MTSGQRVLVVDGLSETEQVLKAVLEPQGLEVDRIRHRCDTAGQKPSVVVIHEDDAPASPTRSTEWNGVPRVIIGTAQIDSPDSHAQQYLAKPFQYGDLICAIERLLEKPASSATPSA